MKKAPAQKNVPRKYLQQTLLVFLQPETKRRETDMIVAAAYM
ncbi:MAG: hypothetical protein WEA56_15565 [Balneolaceae bacterium]